MTDIINLLPDSVANQIAAGEVVQRPASVVKELLENAIDANATEIILNIKEGGTIFIQVTDNGMGMSETDARMCWERHATSKIKKASDIFEIFSYGFRGEAMASIAAVAQVEMKTMQEGSNIGTYIAIEGSRMIEQKSISTLVGTQTTVKNLFYNVPARRNFLKSTSVETKHIFEEFYRVALARPDLHLKLFNNNKEVYDLEKSTLKERIQEIFRVKHSEELLNTSEDTDIVKISGYVGAPNLAKKTRGEQYIFVNNRFIKNPYFNHAIMAAYDGVIEKSRFPLYVLHFNIDPKKIDVNIHPTKTEVKFEDDRFIYQLVQSAVKKSIGQHSLFYNFESDRNSNDHLKQKIENRETAPDAARFTKNNLPRYNPFETNTERRNLKNWEKIMGAVPEEAPEIKRELYQKPITFNSRNTSFEATVLFQIGNSYIVTKKEDSLLLIDQRKAHERILYDRFAKGVHVGGIGTQTLLFPRTIKLNKADFQLVLELEDEIKQLGFDFSDFGNDTLILNGIPAGQERGNELDIFEGLIEQYKYNHKQPGLESREKMLRALALNMATKLNVPLDTDEMKEIVRSLYLCDSPTICPRGKSISISISMEQLNNMIH